MKKKVTKSNAPRERKIGRVFNPVMRGFQYVATAIAAYYLVLFCVLIFIPQIVDMLYEIFEVAEVDNIVTLFAIYVLPCMFAVGMLFIGCLAVIKIIAKKFKSVVDKLIADYKTNQEKIISDADNKVTGSDADKSKAKNKKKKHKKSAKSVVSDGDKGDVEIPAEEVSDTNSAK